MINKKIKKKKKGIARLNNNDPKLTGTPNQDQDPTSRTD
jgi:hypothetical protein